MSHPRSAQGAEAREDLHNKKEHVKDSARDDYDSAKADVNRGYNHAKDDASKGYNKSVDWWSLGILIFEMLCGFTPFWDGGSPMKIYENILKGRVKYPPYISADAQDLLSKLITNDLSKRLGNLVGGSKDIMNHPWFSEVTWDRLMKKDIDAPYVPPVRAGAGDASQFDKYPEETEAYGQPSDDPYAKLFVEF